MSMEGFNEGLYGDPEVHRAEKLNQYTCLIGIANYEFTYTRDAEGMLHLVQKAKPGSQDPTWEDDIPKVLLDRAETVAKKVFEESD